MVFEAEWQNHNHHQHQAIKVIVAMPKEIVVLAVLIAVVAVAGVDDDGGGADGVGFGVAGLATPTLTDMKLSLVGLEPLTYRYNHSMIIEAVSRMSNLMCPASTVTMANRFQLSH